MPQRTLDQKRAQTALTYLRSLLQESDKEARARYLGEIKQAPGLIAVNGLVPALLHLNGSKIREHIEAWLTSGEAPVSWKPEEGKRDVSERLLSQEAAVYRQATEEALRFTAWLKRWAQAYFEEAKSAEQAAQEGPSS
jgi:CRISPR type III-B/RAMP module-associated protein Cmr5